MTDDRRTLLVGTNEGVHRIEGDLGAAGAWGRTDLLRPGDSVRGLGRHPGEGTLYAGFGLRGSGLHRSTDDGASWEPVPGWPTDRQAFGIAFRDGEVLVGGQPADVWHGRPGEEEWRANESVRSIPGRSEWTFVHEPHEAHILGFARHPSDPARWLAAVEVGGVLASSDGGRTWESSSPAWDTHVVWLGEEGAAVAATAGGLKVSTDGGGTWETADGPSGYATGLTEEAGGGLLAAVKDAEGGPLWRSTDGGRSWQLVEEATDAPHPGHGVHALEADPVRPGLVYHGAEDGVWAVEGDGVRRLASDLPGVRRLLVEA